MARKFLIPIDGGQLELLNWRWQQVASDPSSPALVEGQKWYRTDLHRERVHDGTAARSLATLSDTLDQFGAPAGDVSWNSRKITSLATPTNPGDAAPKSYVDAAISNQDYHLAVRYMAVVALPAYTYANGSSGVGATITANATGAWTIDGQSLTLFDRVFVPDQYPGVGAIAQSASDAGLYTVTTVGAGGVATVLTRALDFNTATTGLPGTIAAGAAVFVETGTAAKGSAWLMNQQAAITVGTTSLTWTQVGAAGSYSATAPITLTGSAFGVAVDGATVGVHSSQLVVRSTGTAGQTLVSDGTAGDAAAWGQLDLSLSAAVKNQLPIANGGTGASSAAAGLAALGGAGVYTTTVGDGSATSYVITHGLSASKAKIVAVYNNTTPFGQVDCDVQYTSTTTITLVFAVAPTSAQYQVVVIG